MSDVNRSIAEKRRKHITAVDMVFVPLPSGVTLSVKFRGSLSECFDPNIFGENCIGCLLQVGDGIFRREEEVCDLAFGVDTGIGPAGTNDFHAIASEPRKGRFHDLLHSKVVFLLLPSMITGPQVLEGGFVLGALELIGFCHVLSSLTVFVSRIPGALLLTADFLP